MVFLTEKRLTGETVLEFALSGGRARPVVDQGDLDGLPLHALLGWIERAIVRALASPLTSAAQRDRHGADLLGRHPAAAAHQSGSCGHPIADVRRSGRVS